MRNRVKRILDRIGKRTDTPFRIVFPDGSSIQNHDRDPVVTILFKSKVAELRVLLFGHVGLLESYFDQSVDIEGDIAAAFRAAMDSGFDKGSNLLIKIRNRWHEWRFSNRRWQAVDAWNATRWHHPHPRRHSVDFPPPKR